MELKGKIWPNSTTEDDINEARLYLICLASGKSNDGNQKFLQSRQIK